jgi:antitoxin HigA-1
MRTRSSRRRPDAKPTNCRSRHAAVARGRSLLSGESWNILLDEFLIPLGISQYRLAKAIDVPPRRINEIVHGNPGDQPGYGSAALQGARHVGPILDEPADRYDLDVQLEVHRDELDRLS